MQHVISLKAKSEVYKGGNRSRSNSSYTQEEDIARLVECMALNTTSDEDSEASEVDSFLLEEGVSGSGSEAGTGDPEPEFLLPRTPPLSPDTAEGVVDPETQARLEALLEAAGISKLAENKELADPDVIKRLTSSVSSALDEAAAALTRMRSEPSAGDGRSLVAACSQGDISRVRRLLDEGRVSVHETTEEGESLLSLACSAGYYELAQVLLAMRANVEDRGMKGDCTPLMEAASAGHTDIVRLLIAHGADVNAQSSSGNTPLMYACAGGHEDVVRVLLEAGANVEDHNENGHTPLMEAASAGHCSVARILLEFGAGINTHSNEFKESALTLACYKGHLEMVRFLLEAGADQEHKTDEMHTALMEASMDGHVEVARLLLDSGAQVNMPADSFESPLTLAACGGHVELAMLLLERGANIEEVNDEGYTPLMEASREGHEEMVALLLSQGADINAQTEETQETALTLACCGGFLEVADFLIKAGADLELGASTPLMEASQEGHLELVRYLLEARADVNATTGTGDTALTYACENGHTDVADLLLQYNAQLEHESEGGRTPLMKAARAGHLCTVQFLISRGADVNRQTSNNDHTPLSLACAGGHLAVVEVLLQQGADPFHKLKDNSTMLIEAAKGGHTTVVQMLIDYPNSLVVGALDPNAVAALDAAGGGGGALPAAAPPPLVASESATAVERVPPPGSELVTAVQPSPAAAVPISQADAANRISSTKNEAACTVSVLRKGVGGGGGQPAMIPTVAKSGEPVGGGTNNAAYAAAAASSASLLDGSSAGYHLLEDLERKGLDAKTYIQTMLRRTEGSSKEEQIIQKEQILAELQRVEKELQEKAQAQLLMSGELQQQQPARSSTKREAGEGQQQRGVGEGQEEIQPPAPFNFALDQQATHLATTEVLQNMTNLSLASGGRSLATIPPSERPKAKASRKIDGKGGKKSQLQAALQQHSQQLAQLQQLQQLNQQLQQQVLQQRQLKQQNQQTLAALQQNAIANQQQLAALQQNVAQLQQLEQTILAQQTTAAHQQQHQQLQQRVQQIMQQKQQLQHQIKQFQQQVEQQLAYTQHAGPLPPALGGPHPPLPSGPPPPPPQQQQAGSIAGGGGKKKLMMGVREGGDGESVATDLSGSQELGSSNNTIHAAQQDLHFLINSDQLPGFMTSGGIPAGIDPSLLTSAAFELVQASQALQAVQAVPPLLHGESPPIMTPLTQDPSLLSSMDPAQIAAAVQHCPIPLDSALQVSALSPLAWQEQDIYAQQIQVATSGGMAVQYSSALTGVPVLSDCASQHLKPVSAFGHQLLVPPTLACALGQGLAGLQGLPVFDGGAGGGGNVNLNVPAAGFPANLQLPPVTAAELSQMGFVNQDPQQQQRHMQQQQPVQQQMLDKKTGKKMKNLAAQQQQQQLVAATAAQQQAALLDPAYAAAAAAGHYNAATGYPGVAYSNAAGPPQQQQQAVGVPVVDLDSETDSNHDTALTLACAGGHEELVSLLLSRGADNEHRDKKGFTPLILAATAGHDKVVDILLNHGADIEAQSERTKDTPLSLACSGGRYEVVEILLSRGANKEHRNVSDYTPLSLAASGGYTNIIKLLLAHGAEINSRTGSKLGISPLMLAAMNGHTAAVKLLLDMGSDINAQIETNRNTALTLACFQGRHEVVSLLLDRRANVEHRAKTGLTPLMEAASGGYTEVGRVLLDKGADVNAAPVPSSRDTALTIAADKGHYRFVELLLSRGAQVDVRNKKGNSSLWLAANGGHLDVVQLLYSAGADIDSQDNRKVSCLMAAFRKGHSKVVKWLVKHVTQFPSDTELNRFIATISDKDLLKKTHQCAEIIRVAKDRQENEANKAANILLEELEMEKNREESKRAAAARKREKKKRKKAEKKGGSGTAKMDEDDDEEDGGGDRAAEEEEEEEELMSRIPISQPEEAKEKTPEIIEEMDTNRDSGIDANSQGSATSHDKEEKGSTTNNKKNKKKKNKNKEKEKNEKNQEATSSISTSVTTTEEKENNNNAANGVIPLATAAAASIALAPPQPETVAEKEKSPEEEEESQQQPRVPCTIEGHSAVAHEIDKLMKSERDAAAGFIEPVRRGRNRGSRHSEDEAGAKEKAAGQPGGRAKQQQQQGSMAAKSTAATALTSDTAAAGWKEVVRKSKKVSVPSNAISRVIGRGGSNINAIRELSGAHIEVEKQSKGQGDRTILIKGSAEATRLANTWISSIISNPEKDLQEIVGRQQYKLLSANLQQAKGAATAAAGTAAAGGKSSNSAGARGTATAASSGKAGAAAASGTKSGIDSTTTAKKQAATPLMVVGTKAAAISSAKPKPVTSTSFAAIAAAGSDLSQNAAATGFSIAPLAAAAAGVTSGLQQPVAAAPIGKQPLLMGPVGAGKPAAASSASASVQSASSAAASKGKRDDAAAIAGPTSLLGSNLLMESGTDFSPFKAFSSISAAQGFGWGGPPQTAITATSLAGPKGFAQQSAAASQPDLSKAPGYNRGLLPAAGGSNSPVLCLPTSSSSSIGPSASTWSSSSGVIISSPLTTGVTASAPTSAFRKPSGDSGGSANSNSGGGGGGLYPSQERCNSAPGTPVSPLIPSPIAPPAQSQLASSKIIAKSSGSNTTSPAMGEASSNNNSTAVSSADWRAVSHLPQQQHLQQPLASHPQQHRAGSSSLLRSLTPDADFVGSGWLHSDESDAVAGRGHRQGTGSYGHNSPAKTAAAVSAASPIMPPDLFSSSNKPLDSVSAANLQNMAAQLSNLPGNQFDLLSHHHHHQLPPLPDLAVSSPYASFSRFGGSTSRFSAPPISSNNSGIITTSSTATTGGAFGLHQPLMSGMPYKGGLNPYATEFSHGGGRVGSRGGGPPPPPPPTIPPQQQQLAHHHHLQNHQATASKAVSNSSSAYSGYGGGHHFGVGSGGGINNFQTSILTNQGINAYLSQLGVGGGQQQQPPTPLDMGGLGVGLADLNLGGRTLSELTDILGGGGGGGAENQFHGGLLVGGGDQPVLMEQKGLFSSRPIGAERRNAGPSPVGGGMSSSGATVMGRTNKMVDPYAVWELPPSYIENLNAAAVAAAAADVTGFSGFISSLSGQTLASMESLVGGGSNQFNGGGVVGSGNVHHHHMAPVMGGSAGGGFGGMPAASSGSLTPNKPQPDYSDWGTGSTSSSAPGSANKNNHVTGFYERADAVSVRRNINQNPIWPKNWDE